MKKDSRDSFPECGPAAVVEPPREGPLSDETHLRLVASFIESHARDEGGYSDATRADLTDDANRLRRTAGKIEALRSALSAAQQDSENQRQLIHTMKVVAGDAFAAWDSDNTSQCGKLLRALTGLSGYRLDLDTARIIAALRSALSAAKRDGTVMVLRAEASRLAHALLGGEDGQVGPIPWDAMHAKIKALFAAQQERDEARANADQWMEEYGALVAARAVSPSTDGPQT